MNREQTPKGTNPLNYYTIKPIIYFTEFGDLRVTFRSAFDATMQVHENELKLTPYPSMILMRESTHLLYILRQELFGDIIETTKRSLTEMEHDIASLPIGGLDDRRRLTRIQGQMRALLRWMDGFMQHPDDAKLLAQISMEDVERAAERERHPAPRIEKVGVREATGPGWQAPGEGDSEAAEGVDTKGMDAPSSEAGSPAGE